MKTYWWPAKNFGDTLTPIILKEIFGIEAELAKRNESRKLLAVGSIAHLANSGDIIWGTGLNRKFKIEKKDLRVLATRGPITESFLPENNRPGIYGDPALLLPLIYKPEIKKTYRIGFLPHYVDKPFYKKLTKFDLTNSKFIDIQADWKTVIREVLSCELIVASSLHGIICAEAYGIPAAWEIYSDKIVGGELKYQDYFLGTGRPEQKTGVVIEQIKDLKIIQERLIKSLSNFLKK